MIPFINKWDGQSPEEIGNMLDADCAALQESNIPYKNGRLYVALLQQLDVALEHKTARAGILIAADMNSGLFNDDLAYHNINHTHEVLIGMGYLIRQQEKLTGTAFSQEDKSLLLLGAIIHDIGHDGKGNDGTDFKLEQSAFNKALPYFQEAGVDQADQDLLHDMLLVTDLAAKPRPLMSVRRLLTDQSLKMADIHPAWPGKLDLQNPEQTARFALFAGMLSDADLMPSTSWSTKHHLKQAGKLNTETNGVVAKELGPATCQFLSCIDKSLTTAAGKFLQPNMDRLFNEAKLAEMKSSASFSPAQPPKMLDGGPNPV